jgi:hypothetical protein
MLWDHTLITFMSEGHHTLIMVTLGSTDTWITLASDGGHVLIKVIFHRACVLKFQISVKFVVPKCPIDAANSLIYRFMWRMMVMLHGSKKCKLHSAPPWTILVATTMLVHSRLEFHLTKYLTMRHQSWPPIKVYKCVRNLLACYNVHVNRQMRALDGHLHARKVIYAFLKSASADVTQRCFCFGIVTAHRTHTSTIWGPGVINFYHTMGINFFSSQVALIGPNYLNG